MILLNEQLFLSLTDRYISVGKISGFLFTLDVEEDANKPLIVLLCYLEQHFYYSLGYGVKINRLT